MANIVIICNCGFDCQILIGFTLEFMFKNTIFVLISNIVLCGLIYIYHDNSDRTIIGGASARL